MTFMHWTPAKLGQFKRAYAKALEAGVETFAFEGHDFVPGYAKYLIEYLEGAMMCDLSGMDAGDPAPGVGGSDEKRG